VVPRSELSSELSSKPPSGSSGQGQIGLLGALESGLLIVLEVPPDVVSIRNGAGSVWVAELVIPAIAVVM